MNFYIASRVNKESMYLMLKEINSPFAELYKSAYPTKNNIEVTLREFLQSGKVQDYEKISCIKLIEAKALINWIYKSLNRVEERIEATKSLIRVLMEKQELKYEIEIVNGIAYISSKVKLFFISSFEEFCTSIQEASSPERTIFYRGHSQANYILIPSLMRKESWLINERKMYNELLINSPASFEKMKTHLEYLVEMQHYGLPTRLLDITRNALVSLYFACENDFDSYGEVVIFSIKNCDVKYPQSDTVSVLASLPLFEYEKQQEMYKYAADSKLSQQEFNKKIERLLHEVKTEKPAFKDQIVKEHLLHSLVVLPLKNNNRILKQDGAFILCGLSKDYMHLDVNELRYTGPDGKRGIYIIKNKYKILDALNAFSINKATLFPEIDDIADYIKNKY